jgi:hypothetical protein
MCGSNPAPATSISYAARIGAGKYTSGPRLSEGDQCGLAGPPRRLKYGVNMAPVDAGAVITPSRNNFTLRTVTVGSGPISPWS